MEMDTQHNSEQQQNEPQDSGGHKPPLFRLTLTNPVRVIEYVLANQPEEFIHRHFILGGLGFVLLTRIPDWLATTAHPIGVMIQVLILGPILGIILGYIFSAAMRNLARLTKVEIDKHAMRAITAWTNFPFFLSYIVTLATYLVAFFARPTTAKQFILMDGVSGWIPLVVGGITFLYALYLRLNTIRVLFKISFPKTVLLWLAAFVITYGPAIIIGITYFALYTGSMEWLTT